MTRKFLYILLFFLQAILNIQAQNQSVDFLTAHVHIKPNFILKNLEGNVTYTLEVLKKPDTLFLDAVNINFNEVKLNKKAVKYIVSDKKIKIYSGIKKGKNLLELSYSATPKQTVYFTGTTQKHQIWTQGQGKYTSHWLPSFDDVNEKVIFNISISYPKEYEVVANGLLTSTQTTDHLKTWNYTMQNPMSSYLVMFAIGDYIKFTETSQSKTPLEFYLKKEDASKYKSTYAHAIEIFNYLENQIGFNYPWQVYRQLPVDDFLYAGMENTTSTLFSQDFVVDEIGFQDKNYLNVNAHELAHQWFGNLITAKENKHHWLQEGFATFYAMLAEKHIFGEDYFFFDLYDMAEQLIRSQNQDKEPLLSAKASSLTFYKKGAWALYALQQQVGEQNFNLAVKKYLQKHQFKNVETQDFLNEIEDVSKQSTKEFREIWLESHVFPTQQAFQLLTQNKSINTYLEIGKSYDTPLKDKKEEFIKILNSNAYINCKEEVIYQLGKEEIQDIKDFFPIIQNSKDYKLRQAFVRSLGKVTPEYKDFYKSFLNDPSYITQEIVLKNLWSAFPENQVELLNETHNFKGFNDLNLRITWLTLALATPKYQVNKLELYDELLKYTQLGFESNTRQNAIANLLYLNPNDTNVLKSLAQGLTHHKWQFVKFCKEIIRSQLKQEKYKDYYIKLVQGNELDAISNQTLQRILQEKPSS